MQMTTPHVALNCLIKCPPSGFFFFLTIQSLDCRFPKIINKLGRQFSRTRRVLTIPGTASEQQTKLSLCSCKGNTFIVLSLRRERFCFVKDDLGVVSTEATVSTSDDDSESDDHRCIASQNASFRCGLSTSALMGSTT